MNGSVGMVKAIIYESPNGPAEKNALAKYVIVDFKQSTLSADKPMIEGAPSNWIAVPVVTNSCKKTFCSVSAIPLRVCIAMTIHKAQGITVGEGMDFEKLIVYLTMTGQRTTPGIDLVAYYRVKKPEDIAVGNPMGELTIANITNIGNTPAYKTRRDIKKMLKEKDFATQQPTIDAITQLDATVLGEKI